MGHNRDVGAHQECLSAKTNQTGEHECEECYGTDHAEAEFPVQQMMGIGIQPFAKVG